MGRQVLAGFAGFCAACTLLFGTLLLLRDSHEQQPLREAAEPISSFEESLPTASSPQAEHSTSPIHLASFSTTQVAAPKVTTVIINSLPLLVTQPTDKLVLFHDDAQPANVTVEFDPAVVVNTKVTLKNTLTNSATELAPQLNNRFGPVSFAPGENQILLQGQTDPVFTLWVANIVPTNGNGSLVVDGSWMVSPPNEAKADAPTAVTLKVNTSSPLGTFGPLLVSDPGSTATATVTLTSGTPSTGSYTFRSVGTYELSTGRFNQSASIDGAPVDPAPVTVSMKLGKFEVESTSPVADFKPQVAMISQRLETANSGQTTFQTNYRTNASALISDRLKLALPTLDVAFTTKLASRNILSRVDTVVDPASVSAAATPTPRTSPITVNGLSVGEHTIDLIDSWTGRASVSNPVKVSVPSNQLERPQILFYRQQEAVQPLTSVDSGITITGSSLHLIGRTTPGSSLQLLILEPPVGAATTQAPVDFELLSAPITVLPKTDGTWEQDVTVPGISGVKRIVAIASNVSTHQYSTAIPLTVVANDVSLAALGTVKVTYAPPAAPSPLVDAVNGKTVAAAKISVSITGSTGLKPGDIIRTTRDGQVLSDSSLLAAVVPAVVPPVVTNPIAFDIAGLNPGSNKLRLSVLRGSGTSRELPLEIFLINQGPTVEKIEPENFGTAPGQTSIRITFSTVNPLAKTFAEDARNYVLVHKQGQGAPVKPETANLLADTNQVVLNFLAQDGNTKISPDIYELRINAHPTNSSPVFGIGTGITTSGIRDIYGLLLDGNGDAAGGAGEDYAKVLSGLTGGAGSGGGIGTGFGLRDQLALPAVTAEQPNLLTLRVGLPETTGPPVDYPEFTAPRTEQNGFNPSDKVVTRVARLYYFRDAHRVAQIINRRAQSYNAQNATMSRQLADKARLFAEQTVDRRRAAERQAVDSASYARQAENAVDRYQQEIQKATQTVNQGKQLIAGIQDNLSTLEAEAADPTIIPANKYKNDVRTPADRVTEAKAKIAAAQEAVSQSEQQASLLKDKAGATLGALDALRERELQQRETMNREQANEDRAIDHQFRLEVQAAKADPDTYVPGNPDSIDPVARVSISVIGEGLIELRGPAKGVNIVHTMINEIDSPVGQVRVGIHTVQINGEKGPDMEEVAARIQRYTDHSRFLTSQSAQMLRNAVALVASRKAEEFGLNCDQGVLCDDGTIIPAGANGKGIDGLPVVGMNGMPGSAATQRYQDAFFGAEFMARLRAMDSEFVKNGNSLISLHSMDSTSLASALFLMALASNQTRMEILEAFQQSTMCKLPVDEFEYFEASDTKLRYHFKKFKFLADNARFVSLRGYFDSEIVGDNTLNPAQREFIKLAQILKSRLTTEIELKQRVVERALIEERVGNYQQQLADALEHEKMAQDELKKHQTALRTNITTVVGIVNDINAAAQEERDLYWEKVDKKLGELSPREITFGQYSDAAKDRQLQADASSLTSDSLSYILGLPDAWKIEAEPVTLSKISVIVEDAKKEAREALLKGDYKRFMDAVFDMNRDVNALVTLDRMTLPQVRDKLNRPNTTNFASVAIDYGEGVLKLRIERTGDPRPELEWAFTVNVRNPDETGKYHSWIQSKATKIQQDELAQDLPLESRLQLRKELQTAVDFSPEVDNELMRLFSLNRALVAIREGNLQRSNIAFNGQRATAATVVELLRKSATASIGGQSSVATRTIEDAHRAWVSGRTRFWQEDSAESASGKQSAATQSQEIRARQAQAMEEMQDQIEKMDKAMAALLQSDLQFQFATANAEVSRRPLDHKKFLDMLIDEVEEKHIQLLEGTRAHTAVIDDYVKRICTALEDDFNTQFYEPAFRKIREQTYGYGTVSLGQIEHTTILTNNREFAKVQPQATMEFDLPRRRIMVAEAMGAAQAAMNDYGALLNDPTFLALTKLNSGQSTAVTHTGDSPNSQVRDVLPGLPSQSGESSVIQARSGEPEFQSQLEALIPDPAIYKFETGTGFEIRPVIQPDGQSVVFDFNYMYTTNIREPVAADEKHLGRVKRHFIDTDVQIGNYELREVSRYRVALKAERSGRGVPLLEDIPVAGALFRPMNNGESSLQQNIILAQTVIYPTLFDLMGLRWAPAVADLDEQDIIEQEFTYRSRMRNLKNTVYDYSSAQVDEFLRIPQGERRPDLYRTQVTIPIQHPNGYMGPGNGQQDSTLQEGYMPQGMPGDSMVPGASLSPGESGILMPPVESAPLLPIYQGAMKPGDDNRSRWRVTPASHKGTNSTPSPDYKSNDQTVNPATGTARISDLRAAGATNRQNMPQLQSTPQEKNSRSYQPNQQPLTPRKASELGTSPTQTKSSVPISRTAANSSQIPSGRATLDEPNEQSTSLKEPETKRSRWSLRIPGFSNGGK